MLTSKEGRCSMDKVVSVRLPEEVVAWLSDASRFNKTTISGMAKDIILSGYSAMKSELMPALLELKEENAGLKEENEQLKLRQRLSESTKGVSASAPKIGRNAPCPCGSGKKYKLCCGRNE
jgi:preprotein translocase subunit SecA